MKSSLKTRPSFVFIALLCALTLLLSACAGGSATAADGTSPGASSTNGSTSVVGGYIESVIDIADYQTVTAPALASDGSLWAAAQKDSESGWVLLHYADLKANPEAIPLEIEGSVSQISMNTEDEIVLYVTQDDDNFGIPDGAEATSSEPSQDQEGADADPDASADNETAPDASQSDSDGASAAPTEPPPEGQGTPDGQGTPPEDQGTPPDGQRTLPGQGTPPDGQRTPSDGQGMQAPPEGTGSLGKLSAASSSAQGGLETTPAPEASAESSARPGNNNQGGQNMGGAFRFRGDASFIWVDTSGKQIGSLTLTLENDRVSQMTALPGRELIVTKMQGGVERIDVNGKQIGSYGGDMMPTVCVVGDSLYLLNRMNRELVAYDLETGSEQRRLTFEAYDNNMLMAGAPDGSLYFASSSGIWKLEPDATDFASVMDGINYTIGDPSSSISGLIAREDGSLVIALGSGSGGMQFGGGGTVAFRIGGPGSSSEDSSTQWLGYTWNPTLDMSNMKTLTVTSLQDSQMLRKAISEFRREHPDVLVTLNTYMDSQSASSDATDYIRAINAELLAGKGGDVIILDGLTIDTYISKNILLDLSEALSDIGFLPGIWEGSRNADGKIYTVPATFSFSTLWSNQGNITSAESLRELAEQAESMPDGETILSSRTARQLFETFYPVSENTFRDESGQLHFNTQEFEEFLECLAALYVEPDASTETNNPFGGRGGSRSGFSMSELQAVANQSVAYLLQSISGVQLVSMGYSAAGEDDSAWIGVPSLDEQGHGYTPSLMASVNTQSKHTDLATDLVRMLYSETVQETAGMSGLPTVASVIDSMIDTQIEAANDAASGRLTMTMSVMGGASFSMSQPSAETWQELRAFCDTLNQPLIVDQTLLNFMVEETEKFFTGQKSAKDTADALQQRVAAYLAE